MTKLFSIAGFYKSDKPEDGGFSFTISEHTDEFAAALDTAYGRFKKLDQAEQRRYIDDTPRQLASMKSLIREGQGVTVSSNTILLGLLSIFILEKLKLIPSDDFNGMQYVTQREVDAFRKILDGGLRPGVSIISYAHDAGCPKLAGRICNCKADVTLNEVAA
jgi:hypothetical protein